MSIFSVAADRDLTERLLSKVKVDPATGCCNFIGARTKKGYGKITVKGVGLLLVHRVVYAIVHGPFDSNLVVRHSCDNPSCVNPEHLSVGTHADNMQDAVARGRMNTARGTRRTKQAKLTEAIVEEIKRRLNAGGGQRALAREFGVSHTVIYKIANGKQWQHVGVPHELC